MPDEPQPVDVADGQDTAFAVEAKKRRTGTLSEFWYFLRNNKRWWVTPIVIILLLVSLLVLLGGSAAGPLIYPLF